MKRTARFGLALLAPILLAAQWGTAPPLRAQDEKKDEKKEEKWDVNAPVGLGPSHEVTIDVDEGTWISLDVSPDGKEIVFDLLGDLYTIPMAGGAAKALTHDVAWQEQPTYSPDGKRIAFTSDQGGGDNLWTVDRGGKDPKQISKETFRLLNSPVWTPDSNYLAGRKHFTTTRSAGSGEIWLYHIGGGGGIGLTKRPTVKFQKDIGEPAFSPDGRYLYYSRDATAGTTFEYNKDPNTEIYVIERLDRQTGENEAFISGPGGAIRPTPSPDGKSLAFIRRIRGKSVLHVMDLRSGEISPLWDGMERDLQETWAIHGVYPHMSWTPDSKSLVFFANGKINRLEVASKKVSPIPFHVQSTREVFESVRFPVDVAPQRFPLKMLRWVQVAPRGDRVVYQALGKLWIRDLPNGTPRRLTAQNDEVEMAPSFSRDGRSIVYTTWDDTALGSVRVVPAIGGESRKVTSTPGHYAEPTFSPDGKQIVYRRISGGFLRTSAWSNDLGVWRVPALGGDPVRVSKDGAVPQFGAASDRLYLTRFNEDGSELFSVDLNGAESRTVAKGEKTVEYHVSPDGDWVAFVDLWNVYVAPFNALGGVDPLSLDREGKNIPIAKVTREAGWYVHWSGDSKRLYWSQGPELFQRDLKDSFAFLAAAPEKLPEPPTSGIQIGFSTPSDVPKGKVAVVGARIITIRADQTDEVIEDGTVVIDGNRITAVGPRASITVPAGAFVIDGKGKTVMPGIVDVHWHGTFGTDDIIPQTNWGNYASLGFGVTTLHDPSNDSATVFAASELQRAGLIVAPRIFSTGTILYGADTNFMSPIDSLDDARGHLRRMKAVGAISVKSYNQPRRDQRQQVLAAARELGIMVVPEGGSLFQHNMTMVVDGHTGVEHSIPMAKVYADVVQLWSGTKVGYTPTLIVGYGGIWGENYWYDKTHVWEDERLLSFVPREIIDERSRRRVTAPDEEYTHVKNAEAAKKLSDAGVSVQLGAHGQREGLGAHWEIWMFAQGGMTPIEALRSATLKGAQYLGMDKDIGSLEPGKLADLVILSANPLENIRNTTSIDQVIANGRVFDGKTMNEAGAKPQKHAPFFWQQPGRASIGKTSAAASDED
ncbi:MAG TPA: amidohydrolase family protein [Thermoanaerobaculia bacterium]|jgi:imidazolonepropionase-like amidohydrolase/Tol biopolymer transport system component|nr:amidohydrolase family protein [Thermoanaerobaculia bacterium]